MRSNLNKLIRWSPIKVAMPYLMVSTLYIIGSDYILGKFVSNPDEISYLQTVKGLVFIGATTLLIYMLSKRSSAAIMSYYEGMMSTRAQAEKALRLSEEKYWSLFNSSPTPMWIFEIQTLKFLLVNQSAIHHYGYTEAEFLKMTLEDIRPPEEIKTLHEAIPAFGDTRKGGWRRPFKHLKKNGEVLFVRIESSDVVYEGNKCRLVVATDVTNELRYRNELIEMNERMKSAGQTAKLGFWSNDLTTGKIFWSDELYEIFEQDKHTFELTIQNVIQAFHPDSRGQFEKPTPEFLPGKDYTESEQRIVTPKGEIKWILERITLLKNEQGVPIRMDGVAFDITFRKLAEQAIAESNDRFIKLSQSTMEAVIDWDMERDTVFWGEGFAMLFGYNPTDMDKDFWKNHIYPEDLPKIRASVRQSLLNNQHKVFSEEYRFIKSNGELAYVRHRGMVVRNKKGKAIRTVSALSDITAETAYLRQIELQNTKLKEIAWIQSHVVRAPLATLKGLTNLVESQKTGNKEHDQLVTYIKEAADKLDTVIYEVVQKAEALKKYELGEITSDPSNQPMN